MVRTVLVRSLISSAVSAAVVSAALASPQDQETAQDVSQSTVGLEEVVVTARKREESLQDVPVAVTALTEEALAVRQVQSIDDVAKFSPGLVFSKSFGRSAERPVIRGLGSILAGTGPGVEAGAAYFVDGIYYPGDIQSLDLSSVERVEVIRGPQSALYGRNTYSGAINFITRSPGTEFKSSINGNFDRDEKRGTFRMSGPMTEKLGGVLSVRWYDFDGQWVNQATGLDIGQERSTNVSLKLQYDPTDDVSLKLRGQWGRDRDGTRPFVFQSAEANNCYPGFRSLATFNSTPSINRNQYFCGELQPLAVYLNDAPAVNIVPLPGIAATTTTTPMGTGGVYDTRQGLVFSGVERDVKLFSFIGTWDIVGSGYTLTVDGGTRTEERRTGSDSDHSSVNIIPATPATAVPNSQLQAVGANTGADQVEDYSAEIKISSPSDDRFRWTIGAFQYEQDISTFDVDFVSPFGQAAPSQIFDLYNNAVFASAEFDFTERLSATAELRRAKEYKALYNFAQQPNVGRPGGATYAGKRSWTSTTPRLTVNFEATDDLTVYASYAEGNKPGGLNGATAILNGLLNNEAFEQEESRNYELGLKGNWFDRRLQTNIALYFVQNDNMQLTTPVQNAMGAVTSITTNQGDGEVKGIEVEARFAATDNLTFGLTYALADSKFTKGCDDFQWTLTTGGGVLRLDPVTNAILSTSTNPNAPASNTDPSFCSIVGNPYPLSAKNTASVTADYSRPVFGGKYELYLNSDVSYTAKKAVQVHANPFTPAATLVGARLGLQTDKWRLGVYGRNLTNEDAMPGATRWLHSYLIGIPGVTLDAGTPAGVSTSLPRGFFGILRQERQVGVDFTYNFF